MSSSSNDSQWAWLGLLKWSLSYSDGTSDSPPNIMSAEDKEFLEEVMKNGILDENERMKVILEKLANAMQAFQRGENVDIDELQELLLELRDIVEQIDFARAFCSLQGLAFLLGAIQERDSVPIEIRISFLGILATLCQNNPPVQLELLEKGSLRILSDLFFVEDSEKCKTKIMQAMSANVRNHAMGEQVFTELEQACAIMEQGLGVSGEVGDQLQSRTLFFLRALITSDNADHGRVVKFKISIAHVADQFLQASVVEIRELSLELLNAILDQRHSVNLLLSRKDSIGSIGVARIAALRALENQYGQVELELLETLLQKLAIAQPDPAPLLLGAPVVTPESLAQ